jgi:hypothetical protein
MNHPLEWSLSLVLAHSAVFFQREEWLPVAGATGNGKSGDGTTSQEETNEQVAGETGGSQSPAIIAGAQAAVGGVSRSTIGGPVGGRGNIEITSVETSDPAVTLGALSANENIAGGAFDVANHALADEESTATASIEAGAYDTQLNDQFGEAALQAAGDVEAANTTALEAMSTESQQNASNALAAAQNETLAGVTPAQQFQNVGAGGAAGTIFGYSVNTIATWLTVIVAIISLAYFLRAKKAPL